MSINGMSRTKKIIRKLKLKYYQGNITMFFNQMLATKNNSNTMHVRLIIEGNNEFRIERRA